MIGHFLSYASFSDIFIMIMVCCLAALGLVMSVEEQWHRVNRRRKRPSRARRRTAPKWKFSRG